MRMEFHALDFGVVFAQFCFFLGQAVNKEYVFIHVGVEADGSPHAHAHAFFELCHDGIIIFRFGILAALGLEEFLAGNAVRIISEAERQELRTRLELDGLESRTRAFANRPFENDILHLAFDLIDLANLSRNATAKDQVARSRDDDGPRCCRTMRSCFFLRSRCGSMRIRLSLLFLRMVLAFFAHGSAILLRIEAVIHFKVLQDFLTRIALDAAAVAEHPLHDLPHDMRHGMSAHDLAAQLARYIDEDVAAIHRIFRAFQKLVHRRIPLRRLVDQLGPDLVDGIFYVETS